MFLGILFLLFGVLFLVEMAVPEFSINFRIIWPSILVIFSIYQMIKQKRIDIFLVVLFILGGWALLHELNLIPFNYRSFIGPIILIAIGLTIIFQGIRFKNQVRIRMIDGIPNYYGIFGGVEERIKDKDFKGATIYAIFGGVELDLRDIIVKENEISIQVYSVFGGTDLVLPKDVNVKLHSISIFGGTENKCDNDEEKDRPTIHINSYAIFGGTTLK